MARREQDLNGADGAINGTPSSAHWQSGYQRGTYSAAHGEPYRADERHDAEDASNPIDGDLSATGPNLLVGRVALTQDAYDRERPSDQVDEQPLQEDEQPGDLSGTAEGLLSEEEAEEFRSRWPGIKATFVDDPHDSIRQADLLLREVTDMVMRRVHDERSRLATLWEAGGEASTEDLRMALRGYQGFFDQLADVPERNDG